LGKDSHNRTADILHLAGTAIRQKLDLGEGDIMVDSDLFDKLPKAQSPRYKNLEEFEKAINKCTKCPLHKGRNKFVFGIGDPNADVIFVGEGPGRDEDIKGEPFVGRAGQLLDKILAAINFKRSEVYIGNVVKCRPPGNRDPEPVEMETCLPYLMEQIRLIDPKIVCCLGRIAAQALLDTKLPLGKLRGYFHEWYGRKLIVTYHPAALLRFQQYKQDTWKDVQMLRAEYDNLKAAEHI
jgi:uracil-DNA glycosylase family 4